MTLQYREILTGLYCSADSACRAKICAQFPVMISAVFSLYGQGAYGTVQSRSKALQYSTPRILLGGGEERQALAWLFSLFSEEGFQCFLAGGRKRFPGF